MTSQNDRCLDATDWRILAALQENARMSFSALGRRVALSAPAAAHRVRRLEDAGIITGYRVVVAPQKMGYPIIAVIRVSAREENCTRLATLVRGLPGVLETYRITGTDRLLVKVAAASVPDLDSVVRQLSHYGTATASIVLSSRSNALGRPAQHDGAL